MHHSIQQPKSKKSGKMYDIYSFNIRIEDFHNGSISFGMSFFLIFCITNDFVWHSHEKVIFLNSRYHLYDYQTDVFNLIPYDLLRMFTLMQTKNKNAMNFRRVWDFSSLSYETYRFGKCLIETLSSVYKYALDLLRINQIYGYNSKAVFFPPAFEFFNSLLSLENYLPIFWCHRAQDSELQQTFNWINFECDATSTLYIEKCHICKAFGNYLCYDFACNYDLFKLHAFRHQLHRNFPNGIRTCIRIVIMITVQSSKEWINVIRN